MNKYMVFDVGCIECGEPSRIVGFFATIDEAKSARDSASEDQEATWRGQHSFEIYDTDTKEEIV